MTNVDIVAYKAHKDSLQILGKVTDFGEDYISVETMSEDEMDSATEVIENMLKESGIARASHFSYGGYFNEKVEKWESFDKRTFPIDEFRMYAFPHIDGRSFLYQILGNEVIAVGEIEEVLQNTIEFSRIYNKEPIEKILKKKFPDKEVRTKGYVYRGDRIHQLELGSRYRVLWI